MKKLLLSVFAIFVLTISAKAQMPCSDFCVLNINNVDTTNNTLDVTIYNGSTTYFMNYPIVVVVNSLGDTIANINNLFYYFGHLAGDTLVHTIPCTVDSIPAGFTGTVYYTDPIDSTTCMYAYPMSCTVGINEYVSGSEVTIYPNPAKDRINISIAENDNSSKNISIYDVTGKIVTKLTTSESFISLDRGDLGTGIYFLQITSGNSIINKKIILE